MKQLNVPKKTSKMTTKLLGLCALVLFLLTSVASNAQDTREVSLTEEGYIQLSEDQEPDGRFVFDISHMEFESDSEMSSYFKSRCCENFVLRALPHENKVYMIVRGDKQPNWSVSDWNAHIAERLEEQPILND